MTEQEMLRQMGNLTSSRGQPCPSCEQTRPRLGSTLLKGNHKLGSWEGSAEQESRYQAPRQQKANLVLSSEAEVTVTCSQAQGCHDGCP